MEAKGARPQWNGANCAQRHFASRARLSGEAGRRRDNVALARLLAASERGVDGRRPAAARGLRGRSHREKGVCGGSPACGFATWEADARGKAFTP